MTLRQAAALALFGWYLMTPPMIETQKDWENYSLMVPLSKWNIRQSFDFADQCQAVRMQGMERAQRAGNPVPLAVRPDMMAECISTDDPRLKP